MHPHRRNPTVTGKRRAVDRSAAKISQKGRACAAGANSSWQTPAGGCCKWSRPARPSQTDRGVGGQSGVQAGGLPLKCFASVEACGMAGDALRRLAACPD